MPNDKPAVVRSVETTVTFLEMTAPPNSRRPYRSQMQQIALLRAQTPPTHFYRYLYDTVGKNYHWVKRRTMKPDDLRQLIQSPALEIYVLNAGGVPAGMGELDFTDPDNVELTYMGIAEEYFGRGLGTYLLSELTDLVWARHPRRFHLQTCTLDHPRALAMYQKHGFKPCGQQVERLDLIEGWPHFNED